MTNSLDNNLLKLFQSTMGNQQAALYENQPETSSSRRFIPHIKHSFSLDLDNGLTRRNSDFLVSLLKILNLFFF